MGLFLKALFVIVVIILVALIILPVREYFGVLEDTALALSNKSTVKYSDKTLNTDDAYLKSLGNLGANNELLIMYRCIEFVKGGIDTLMGELIEEKTFYISKKQTVMYKNFEDIKLKIEDVMKDIHTNVFLQKPLYGPMYLLITQYPVYTSMKQTYYGPEKCQLTTLSSPLENSYSPLVQTADEGCINNIDTAIECEFYILMPSHKIDGTKREGISWDDIKTDMGGLLIGNVKKNKNVRNVRSQDKQCFTTCGTIEVDGYACAARNGVNSTVYNSPTNNNIPKVYSDYANLYILNRNGVNNDIFKTTVPGTEIVQEGFISRALSRIRENFIETQAILVDHIPTVGSPITNQESTTNDNEQKNQYLSRYAYNEEMALKNMTDDDVKCYMDRYPTILTAEEARDDWVKKVMHEDKIYKNFTKGCLPGDLDRINLALAAKISPGREKNVAVSSARELVGKPGYENGVYWIDLPIVGPTQVYCILDPAFDGGGWMLAMKGGPNSTTFKYDSDYWIKPTTWNSENPSIEEGDAKYDIFNHFAATDWFAGFPDVYVPQTPTRYPLYNYTGDLPRGVYNGYTWIEKDVNIDPGTGMVVPKTLLSTFSNNIRITKSKDPTKLRKFNPNVWSSQKPFQFYGINYKGGHGYRARWGFGWNENSVNDERSNDAGGGIGTRTHSAGDSFSCCGIRGLNRPMRFEFYVR